MARPGPWAWAFAVAFAVIHVVADLGFLADRALAIDKVIGLLFIVASLIYLLRPRVRAYFGA